MGLFPHKFLSAEFPGYTGRLQPQNGTIAQYLRAAGYSTYALGKWHQTPDDELTDLGPFDRWPSGKGFDHFYGFLGGADDQYKTDLVEDDRHIKPDGRHLMHSSPTRRSRMSTSNGSSRRKSRSLSTSHPAQRIRRTRSN